MTDGLINVCKEGGYTSFDVVAKLRGILKIRRIGHTGTLDPAATGVLPVCVGRATRVADMLTDAGKVYVADLLLGTSTDTQDLTGTVTGKAPVSASEQEVRDVIYSFIGDSEQIPPMYSARRVGGKHLYDLAREGITVERKATPIHITDIRILKMDLPHVIMEVHCSKGTYIRTLCSDIGARLGCGGCMASLRRTAAGPFQSDSAHTLSEIEDLMAQGRIDEIIIPVDTIFDQLRAFHVPDSLRIGAVNGAAFTEEMLAMCQLPDENAISDGEQLRGYLEDGAFLGIYEWKESALRVRKFFYSPASDIGRQS